MIWFARRIVGDIPASILSKVSQLLVTRRHTVVPLDLAGEAQKLFSWFHSAI
jgi:hypothetical protein